MCDLFTLPSPSEPKHCSKLQEVAINSYHTSCEQLLWIQVEWHVYYISQVRIQIGDLILIKINARGLLYVSTYFKWDKRLCMRHNFIGFMIFKLHSTECHRKIFWPTLLFMKPCFHKLPLSLSKNKGRKLQVISNLRISKQSIEIVTNSQTYLLLQNIRLYNFNFLVGINFRSRLRQWRKANVNC